jgi:hypothetical protein
MVVFFHSSSRLSTSSLVSLASFRFLVFLRDYGYPFCLCVYIYMGDVRLAHTRGSIGQAGEDFLFGRVPHVGGSRR